MSDPDEDGPASRPDAGTDRDEDPISEGSHESGRRAEEAAAGSPAEAPNDGVRTHEDAEDTDDPDLAAGTEEADDAVLADEPLGKSRRIDGKVRYQWVVGSMVGAAIGAVVVAGLFQLLGGRIGVQVAGEYPLGASRTTVVIALVAFVAFSLLAALRAVLLYRSWRYEVRADSLYLTRGVLTRVQTVAPYVRVQHIDTRRSPVERLLGLSSLVVYTAGSRGADVTIPGLTDARAAELQRRLKRLAIASEEEDAV
jgi:membrane protein YdbS with pleckstrin-like domain